MADVATRHPAYTGAEERWKRNRAAVKGRDAIRAGGEVYLPRPDGEAGPEADARYKAYADRAQWYAAPERTKNALVGAVFRKGPKRQELPAAIAYLAENADGTGASLEQVGKRVVGDQIEAGRIGVLVDYPSHDLKTPSAEDTDRLGLKATLKVYPTEAIINWRTGTVNGDTKPVLVVLAEKVDGSVDLFDHKPRDQYRVLLLVDDVYVQRVYDDRGNVLQEYRPTDASGAAWREIPFIVAGADENAIGPQDAPLTALCDCAISFWQVSADQRENLHIHGQLTLGIQCDMDWKEFQEANPRGVRVGAATGIFLGASGALHTATAPESSALSKALVDLREEMAELGAQIVQKGGQAQTAEAARIDAAAESSVLSHVVGNASEALEQALEWAAVFMGANPDQVQFQLNQEFSDETLDPQTRTAMMGELDRGLIAKADYRAALRKAGTIPAERTDEMIDAEVAAQAPSLTGQPMGLEDGAR